MVYKWTPLNEPTQSCLSKRESQSQLNQDLWALEQTKCKQNGYYIDMGSHDGQWISNTAVLDNKFKWSGLCIDIHPKNMDKRTCKIARDVVYDKSGEHITFKEAGSLGGITQHIKGEYHKEHTKNAKVTTYVTKSAKDIFEENGVPKVVDFLNMDVEGAELKILEGMEKDDVFDKHCFQNIGVEHNFIEPERSEIRRLLQRNGYKYEGSEQFDDYYSTQCAA